MNGMEPAFRGGRAMEERLEALRSLETREGISVFDEGSVDSFLSDARVGAAVVAPDLKVLWTNSFFREAFGAAEGLPCHRLFFGEEEPCGECGVREVTEGGAERYVARKRPRASGEWFQVVYTPIRTPSGNVAAVRALVLPLTDLLRTEEALRTTQSNLLAMLNNSLQSFVLLDGDLRVVAFNREAEEDLAGLFGARPAEGVPFLELVSPSVARTLSSMFSFSPGEGRKRENLAVSSCTGEIFHYEVETIPILDGEGNRTACLLCARNVTEREQNRQHLEDLLAILPLVMWSWDLRSSRLVQVSGACEEILGFAPEKLPREGIPPEAFLCDEDRPGIRSFLDSILREGRASGEYRVRRADGTFRWLFSRASLGRDNDGTPLRVNGVSYDITSVRELASRLSKTEARYRAAIDTTSQGFLFHDLSAVESVNAAFCAMIGMSPGEIIGKSPGDIVYPEDYPLWEEARKTIAVTDHRNFPIRLRRKDGSPLPVQVSATTLRDGSGKAVGAFSFFTDLSERTAMEEQLREALNGAEEANRAKSAFLANMSHEIRTPMNAILGMTSLVLETDLSPEQRELLEMVDASGKKLMTLLNDILDLSRIEAGKLSLAREPFSLRKTVDQVVKPLFLPAVQKGLFFTADVDPSLGDRFLGDSLRLSQVLLNLCSNALKFTSRGGVSVDVRPEEPGRTGMVLFSVADTGIGIRENQKEKLFQFFSQLDQSRSKQFEGTGLGLAISRELVTAMGGRIWAESREGQGSIFHFTIPLEPAESTMPEGAESGTSGAAVPGEKQKAGAPAGMPEKEGRRILLAEDNPVNAIFAEKVLTSAGHTVVRASSGQEALDVLSGDGPFDLVLMDVQMPGMDGLEAVKRIRAMEQDSGARLPVAALTAYALGEDRELCLAAGMDDCITKPVSRDALLAAVDRLASGSGERQG